MITVVSSYSYAICMLFRPGGFPPAAMVHAWGVIPIKRVGDLAMYIYHSIYSEECLKI